MLYYNTVNKTLLSVLHSLMESPELNGFRLVGGTALSLQVGHRISIDIDMFSDLPYGKIDFDKIDNFLEKTFTFIEHYSDVLPAMGKSYRIGNTPNDYVKLDLFYTDSFLESPNIYDNIRLCSLKDIISMKVDVVQRTGRKKDFWDLHKLMEYFTLDEMIELHKLRYPYNHERKIIITNFTDFSLADEEPNPNCLEGKYWELIKLDFEDWISKIRY